VFLTAWRRIGDIPEERELPWLYGVARNVLLNTNRSHRRRQQLADRIRYDRSFHPTTNGVGPSTYEDQLEELWTALDKLDESDAEILKLANWEHLSHAEIAVALDCSPNAVAIRLYRARKKLSEMLTADRDTSAAGINGDSEPLDRRNQ